MGNKQQRAANAPPPRDLPSEARDLALEIFRAIDTDGSQTIDWEETYSYWKKFAKINTQAMFDAVDADHNGEISMDEWIEFWTTVYNTGLSEEEIMEELVSIRDGQSWACYKGAPKSQARRNE